MGFRVWAHWLTPRGFDTYHYVGSDGRLGIYLFRNRKTKIVIGRTHQQVFHDRQFRPFVLDFERARKEGIVWV